MRHQSFDLRRVTAILLEQKNFGPNVIYYVFWESGGPSADDVDLEVDLKSTSGRPQVNLWYLPTHLTHLPQVDLKSTSGRLGSQPRRHKVSFLGYNKRDVAMCTGNNIASILQQIVITNFFSSMHNIESGLF